MAGCSVSNSNNVKRLKENQHPNILWIVADDLGADLGCYGTPAVKTTNLDLLAGQGTLYTNCYTVTAVCSPSRSTLMTGMYPVSIDCHQHRTHNDAKKPLPVGVEPITTYFKKAGYFTSNGQFPNKEKPGKQDYNFMAENIFDGTDWSQRKPGQPFFSQIQISSPHRPFKGDKNNPVNPDSLHLPACYPDHPIARKDWALYLENVQVVDQMVGQILSRLKKDGLDQNTVVFFFGDQGHPHVRAKQFLYDGGIHTPLIIRSPDTLQQSGVVGDLISNIDIPATSLALAGIPVPKHIKGIPFMGNNASRREFVFSMRDRRDETVDRIRSIRSKEFKYIRNFYPERPYTQFNTYKKTSYPTLTLMQVLHKQGNLTQEQAQFMAPHKPDEELYDVINDPDELHNLAALPSYQEQLIKFRALMDDWLAEVDTASYPEDPEQVDFWGQNARKAYQRKMKRFGLPEDVTDEALLEWWDENLDKQLQQRTEH
ncbi:MAG: sulfatase [Carboxylicivirga sp.]|nr:sulfatase [Carboxylicivirga sp.]